MKNNGMKKRERERRKQRKNKEEEKEKVKDCYFLSTACSETSLVAYNIFHPSHRTQGDET